MKKNKPTKAVPTTPQLETVSLERLIPHPDQPKYFSGYGSFEYEALKADIAANGIQHPPVVLPAGNAAGLKGMTLIAGHTRTTILRELGEKTAKVIIRHDLKNATRAEIDELFLKDNVARRQQSKLAQARAAVRLYEIEKEKKEGRKYTGDPLDEGDLRDRIGKLFGMSGRNLQRYIHVLSAPVEVQDALESKRIKLVEAAQVATFMTTLWSGEQERRTSRLRAGEDIKVVFNEIFRPRDGKHIKPNYALNAFVLTLDKARNDLWDRTGEVGIGAIRSSESQLRWGIRLINNLLAKLKSDSK